MEAFFLRSVVVCPVCFGVVSGLVWGLCKKQKPRRPRPNNKTASCSRAPKKIQIFLLIRVVQGFFLWVLKQIVEEEEAV